MILNIDAICKRGVIGGIMLMDGKYSDKVEFMGPLAYRLLISDAPDCHEKGNLAPTGVVWLEDKVWITKDGDGRIYLFRDGIVERLDVNEENRDGLQASMEITGRIQEDDILLICSDGLAEVLNDDYLEYFLTNSPSPAEELAEWALMGGFTGNVSVIAARVGGGEFGCSDEFHDDDGRFDAWV